MSMPVPPGEGAPHLARQTVTTYEVLDWEDVPESVRHHFRKRGKNPNNQIDVKKRTCMLYLQADHLFYENMGSEEACIEAMTRHVQRVNSIYNPIGKFNPSPLGIVKFTRSEFKNFLGL